MKHKLGYLLTAALAMVLTTAGVISTKTSEKALEPTFAGYTNGDGATYYSGISSSATGDTLLSALRSLNSTKRKATVGYSSMGTTPAGQFKYTDYTTDSVKYDSNGQPYGERIVSFYSGNSTTSFNREHVWPNSHGGNVIESDIHMPRPTIASENGSRGNSFYVEGKCSSTSGWDPAMESFGDATYRGDSARIIFYCMLVDTRLSLIEADSHSTSNSNKDYMMGRLSDLIKWNINYPVLDREQRRNEGAEYLQGNRNPFIDHPEYACKIWGSTNSTTQSLCSNATYPTESHSAGIRIDDGYNIASTNTQAYTLAVGDSVNFLPFVDGAYNASVSWNLSDYDVASSAYYGRSTYTNGVTITGVAAGTSTLTLSYSYTDNNETKYATATCLITVTTSGQSGEGGGDASDVTNVTSATYTVATTSTVNNTGTVPSGSSASYSQTFTTKGQITGGKNAVLALSGYTGKVITGIKLNMKSNGSSGAGSLSVTAGSTSLASTSGTFDTWYDNDSYGTNYRDINVTLTNSSHIIANNETITITITGSTNSLYINSYTITYGDPDNGSGEVEESVLTLITASGMTQNYVVGDTFSFDGVLTAHYSDGNSETVIPDTVSIPNMSTAGNQTITLTYSENEVEKSTTYVIYVSAQAKTLTSISIATAPTKISYVVDETFDPTGLVITRNYSDSTNDTYTYANHTSEFTFSPSTSTTLTTANTSVTITYSGQSCSQSITVTTSGGGVDPVSGDSETIVMSEQGYSDTADVSVINGTNCTLTFSKNTGSNGPKYYNSGSSVRMYSGNTLNISSSNTIIQITITFGSSDGSNSITVNVGSFNSPKWQGSSNSVTFTIGGSSGNRRISSIEIVYESSSTPVVPTSISASVSKTYYVGETINASDISVKDNNNQAVTSFTFANDGYQFTYEDAASGGALTEKTFANAISGVNLTCSLTVQVQRKQHADTSSQDLSVTYTDLPTSYQTSTSERTAASGVKFIAYNLANYSSKMQFQASGGYFQTTESMSLKTLTINNRETNALTVYGSTNGTSFSTTITGSNDVYDLTGYSYVKVKKNGSGAAYCASLTITVEGGDTAVNLANFVMYEDTNNQCTSKFTTAKGYFEGLSTSERSTFMTSNDYVISTARTRLEAWARHEGKTITQTNGDYVVTSATNVLIQTLNESTSSILIIAVIGLVAIGAIGGYFFIKKRKEI